MNRILWLIRTCMVLFGLAALGVNASEATAAFDQANKLYEQGKYGEAIAAYQKLLDHQEISASLYFNLANSFFKSGKTGEAIVYYRLAERLSPRDPDIRANLRFVRDSIGAKPARSVRWEPWLDFFTLRELTLLTAAAVWIWMLALAAGEWRRDWAIELRPYRRWLAMITVLLLVWFGLVAHDRLGTETAVVVAREANVRYGPFEEAKSFYRAGDGAELQVLDRKDSWFQVQDASNRVGWVAAKEVFILPRG